MKVPILSKSAPANIGPYSQAIKAGGFVFVAGEKGLDVKTGNELWRTPAAVQRSIVTQWRVVGCQPSCPIAEYASAPSSTSTCSA